MQTKPTADDARELAARYGAAGVAVLAMTSDGRVAYAHHGLTRYLGAPAGAVPDETVRLLEGHLRAMWDGTLREDLAYLHDPDGED